MDTSAAALTLNAFEILRPQAYFRVRVMGDFTVFLTSMHLRGAAMWEALLKEGLYVNLARPPATPAGMTLLRCSLCAEHSSEEVETILGMFERAGKAVGII